MTCTHENLSVTSGERNGIACSWINCRECGRSVDVVTEDLASPWLAARLFLLAEEFCPRSGRIRPLRAEIALADIRTELKAAEADGRELFQARLRDLKQRQFTPENKENRVEKALAALSEDSAIKLPLEEWRTITEGADGDYFTENSAVLPEIAGQVLEKAT